MTITSQLFRFAAASVVVILGLAVGVILPWWALGLYLFIVLLVVTSRRPTYRRNRVT